jgi:drug/metabolite transporter (DMT)-like permease
MIMKYKARAHVWSIAGIITQVLGLAGIFSTRPATGDMNPAWAGALLLFIGTVILCFGLYFYALAKNRRTVWALTGLLSLPGFLIVHFLTDESKPVAKRSKRS